MELKIDNWNKVTINTYMKLKEIADGDFDNVDMEINIVALLADCDEDTILNLPIPQYRLLRTQAQFISNMPKVKAKGVKSINLAGKKYTVVTDMTKLTTAQYIDFQTYYKLNDFDKYLPSILACFVIPENKIYGEYDVNEVSQIIADNMPVIMAFELCAFFQKAFLNLMKGTLYFLERQLKKMKMEKKQRKEIMNQLKQVRLTINGAGLARLMMFQKQ